MAAAVTFSSMAPTPASMRDFFFVELAVSMSLCHRVAMPATSFRDLDAATHWCARWLRVRSTSTPREKLAAIFDIDGTLVLEDKRIDEVCALFNLCRELGITPFIITARDEEGRSYTIQQLNRLGIYGYKRLFMQPSRSARPGREKNLSRERIEAHGYTVCFNAGDAMHDHFYPPPPHGVKAALREPSTAIFITPDGVAHLKLIG